jgi:hypothetical protein
MSYGISKFPTRFSPFSWCWTHFNACEASIDQSYQSVDVIGHDDEGVQVDVFPNIFGPLSFLCYDPSGFTQIHSGGFNSSEMGGSAIGVGGDEVPARKPVVMPW